MHEMTAELKVSSLFVCLLLILIFHPVVSALKTFGGNGSQVASRSKTENIPGLLLFPIDVHYVVTMHEPQ